MFILFLEALKILEKLLSIFYSHFQGINKSTEGRNKVFQIKNYLKINLLNKNKYALNNKPEKSLSTAIILFNGFCLNSF